jgi:hypothetical protein
MPGQVPRPPSTCPGPIGFVLRRAPSDIRATALAMGFVLSCRPEARPPERLKSGLFRAGGCLIARLLCLFLLRPLCLARIGLVLRECADHPSASARVRRSRRPSRRSTASPGRQLLAAQALVAILALFRRIALRLAPPNRNLSQIGFVLHARLGGTIEQRNGRTMGQRLDPAVQSPNLPGPSFQYSNMPAPRLVCALRLCPRCPFVPPSLRIPIG